MANKQMGLREAVETFIQDGDAITLSGMVSREPYALCCEILRQKKRHLTLITDATADCAELLISGGALDKVEFAFLWISSIGQGYNFRRAVEKGIPNHIETEEYSNLGMSMRFMAGAGGLPFMPTYSLIGTDLVNANPKIKIMNDPYKNQPIALVPAAEPDVAILHVQRADQEGNVQIWGMTINDDLKARAAKKVIITCEEIISTDEIRRLPNLNIVPSYCVSAVVELPFGAFPGSVFGYYWIDQPFRQETMAASKTRPGVEAWLDKWVYVPGGHEQFLQQIGEDRLNKNREMEHGHYQIPKIV